ncbi:hypothetical protein ACQ4PT_038852 [Festuca glaucescens]
METIPAASAMDWSIDLDRSLRSRHLGTRLQALDAAAPRIRELASCPTVPPGVASSSGIMPAESRVFAETMLLRLATEFRAAADDSIRSRIVRSLLPNKGGGWAAAEPEQILRRVTAAHGAAGATPRARALALRMFGCLADLAKDSFHVCSLVLSGLRSSNAAEVKAALFAAGCFCKLSEDFACITLQVLAGLVTSPTSEAQVIIAAIKTFSKLDCTFAVIRRVREVGKEMVLGNLEDVFKAEMLFALSRLASKSIVFFGDQVEFLLLFLGHESSLPMKSMALKCLCFMFRRNTFYLPVASTVFGTLLHLIDDEGFPLECKSYALRILQKMLCVKGPTIRHINASELTKLALAAERFLHCSSWEMLDTALRILVDIFFCFHKQTKPHQSISTLGSSSFSNTGHQGISNNMLATHEENSEDESSLNKILTVLMDHIISLANQLSNRSKEVETRQTNLSSCEQEKCRTLFSLMLKLVSGYPSAASVALDKVRCLIIELARINASHYSDVAASCVESFVAQEQFRASDDITEPATASIKASHMETDTDKSSASTDFCSKKSSVVHDLILCTLQFAIACHGMCYRTSGSSCNPHHSIKGLTECVQQNASQYCSTYEFFRLIMSARISWNTCKVRNDIGNKESGGSKEYPEIFSTPGWIAHELCALRMAKMLTRKQSYWEAYRSAMYCCREGLWFTASFVFRKVSGACESGSFSFWFKSLLLFGAGELEMKLLVFPSAINKLVGELNTEGVLHEDLYCIETDADSILARSQELHGCQEKITGICERTCLANDVLASNASSDCEFFFQRWFISLRASFLEILTDVLGILSAHSSAPKDISHLESRGDSSYSVATEDNQVLLALTNCSLRLSDLAKSYDLLDASHGDMDQQSFTTVARLAFMCSLLSFCTVFSLDFSNLPSSSEPCRLPERFSHASVLQDLHERVDRKDSQVLSQLRQFISVSSHELDSVQFSTRMNCSGYLEKDTYSLFKFAVASLLRARADAKGVATTREDTLSQLHRGMQFLSSILQRLMELPFVLPKYFFSVRPCFGAELFIFDSNPANRDGVSISPGSQLSLTLCLQWKRVLERTHIRIAKLYCILATSPSLHLHTAGTRSKQFEMRRTAEMVVLNSRLLRHIKRDPRKTCKNKSSRPETDLVMAFACFAPDGGGQGFSDCLLDISSFPVGSYQVAWQACCVDENGGYFSLLPLNDGVVFSVR